MERKNINRATLLLVLVAFTAIWILINAGQIVLAGLIFLILPLASIILYRQWKFIGGSNSKLEGINDKWIRDSFIGISVVGGIIVLDNFIPGLVSIGLPPVQAIADKVGQILIIVVCAPIAEELFFRDLMHDFFESKGKLGFILSALITSALFSLFHLNVYSESLQAGSGSFITAFFGGMLFSLLNKFTNSNASNISAHMTFNLWTGNKLYGWFLLGG